MKAYGANMDDIDRKLLSALRRDSRTPLSDLATELGVSRATVRTRIARMVAQGDILAFTVQTPADVAQSPVRGLMLLGIEGQGTERIIHQLTGWPAVQAVHSTNGKWDLIVELGTETLEELDKVLLNIRKIDGVTTSETNLLLSTRAGTRRR